MIPSISKSTFVNFRYSMIAFNFTYTIFICMRNYLSIKWLMTI